MNTRCILFFCDFFELGLCEYTKSCRGCRGCLKAVYEALQSCAYAFYEAYSGWVGFTWSRGKAYMSFEVPGVVHREYTCMLYACIYVYTYISLPLYIYILVYVRLLRVQGCSGLGCVGGLCKPVFFSGQKAQFIDEVRNFGLLRLPKCPK